MTGAVRCRSRDLVVVALAAVVVATGARVARDDRLGSLEARGFAAFNRLSDRAFVPMWTVMQLGSLGGSLATGGAVAAAGRPDLGRRLATVGALTWLGSKAIKPFVGRGRPATMVDGARVRGKDQSGLGYPSGHAGVAVAMAAVAARQAPRALRPFLWLTALGVGATRLYVGAHLPLDVAGGIALGVGTERAVRMFAPTTPGGRCRGGRHGSSVTPRSARSSWRSWRRE